MTGLQFAWELLKLILGFSLIMAAAIYTLARFADSLLNVELAADQCDSTYEHVDGDQLIVVGCDKEAGHAGLHYHAGTDARWSDNEALVIVEEVTS